MIHLRKQMKNLEMSAEPDSLGALVEAGGCWWTLVDTGGRWWTLVNTGGHW